MLSIAGKLVNDIPLGKSPDNLFICPNDILGRGGGCIRIRETASRLATVNMMMQRLKRHADMIKDIRRKTLEAEIEKFRAQNKKEGRLAIDVKPSIGDIVLVRDDEKYGYSKFGVVTAIPSQQTLTIKVKSGKGIVEIQRPSSITTPLVAQSLF